jgi:hypothetical protein
VILPLRGGLTLIGRILHWIFRGTSLRAKYLKRKAIECLIERKRDVIDILTEKELVGRAVCLGGIWNWFHDENGKFPQIDLVFPDIPLAIYVLGPLSAKWAEAREYGYERKEWEKEQDRIHTIKQFATDPNHPMPTLIIYWEDSASSSSLSRRISLLTDPTHKAALI